MLFTTSEPPTGSLSSHANLGLFDYPAKIYPGAIASAMTVLIIIVTAAILLRPSRIKPVFHEDIADSREPYRDARSRCVELDSMEATAPKSPPVSPQGDSTFPPNVASWHWDQPNIPTEAHIPPYSYDFQRHARPKRIPTMSIELSESGFQQCLKLNKSETPGEWTSTPPIRPLAPYKKPQGPGQASGQSPNSHSVLSQSSKATINLGYGRMRSDGRHIDIGSRYEGSFIPQTIIDKRVSMDPY